MRPRGSIGPVARALVDAAAAEPGKVRELAARARVAYGVARYTASRLVDAGLLVMMDSGRPARLAAAPEPAQAGPDALGQALMVLHRLPAGPREEEALGEACVA